MINDMLIKLNKKPYAKFEEASSIVSVIDSDHDNKIDL